MQIAQNKGAKVLDRALPPRPRSAVKRSRAGQQLTNWRVVCSRGGDTQLPHRDDCRRELRRYSKSLKGKR
jgi:hypothetical protein